MNTEAQTSIPESDGADASPEQGNPDDPTNFTEFKRKFMAGRPGATKTATGGSAGAEVKDPPADDAEGAQAAASDDTADGEQVKKSPGGNKAADGKERPGKEGSATDDKKLSPEANQQIGRFAKQAREAQSEAAKAKAELKELKAQIAEKGGEQAKATTAAKTDNDDPYPDLTGEDGEILERYQGDEGIDLYFNDCDEWEKRQAEEGAAKATSDSKPETKAAGDDSKANESETPSLPPEVEAQFEAIEKASKSHDDDGTYGVWYQMVERGSLRLTNPILDYLSDPELTPNELHATMNAMMENPVAASKISYLATASKQENALKQLVEPAPKKRKTTTSNAPNVSPLSGSGDNVPAAPIDMAALANKNDGGVAFRNAFMREYKNRTGKSIGGAMVH